MKRHALNTHTEAQPKIQPVSDSAGKHSPPVTHQVILGKSDPVPLARAGFLSLGTGDRAIFFFFFFKQLTLRADFINPLPFSKLPTAAPFHEVAANHQLTESSRLSLRFSSQAKAELRGPFLLKYHPTG